MCEVAARWVGINGADVSSNAKRVNFIDKSLAPFMLFFFPIYRHGFKCDLGISFMI